jgi:putative Holliday junction resolvase
MSESEPPKRILAVDFGDRRTGLAATDFTGTIVTPLPALVGLKDPDCAQAIHDLASERDTQVIVIGLPLDTAGQIGQRAQRTLKFLELLKSITNCPVTTCDERNTTDEAHALLRDGGIRAAKRKKLADSVAALVILNRFRA